MVQSWRPRPARGALVSAGRDAGGTWATHTRGVAGRFGGVPRPPHHPAALTRRRMTCPAETSPPHDPLDAKKRPRPEKQVFRAKGRVYRALCLLCACLYRQSERAGAVLRVSDTRKRQKCFFAAFRWPAARRGCRFGVRAVCRFACCIRALPLFGFFVLNSSRCARFARFFCL